jgi:hypothetical protein
MLVDVAGADVAEAVVLQAVQAKVQGQLVVVFARLHRHPITGYTFGW